VATAELDRGTSRPSGPSIWPREGGQYSGQIVSGCGHQIPYLQTSPSCQLWLIVVVINHIHQCEQVVSGGGGHPGTSCQGGRYSSTTIRRHQSGANCRRGGWSSTISDVTNPGTSYQRSSTTSDVINMGKLSAEVKKNLGTNQCCGSGSGSESGSTCFWASKIRIRIH